MRDFIRGWFDVGIQIGTWFLVVLLAFPLGVFALVVGIVAAPIILVYTLSETIGRELESKREK